MAFDIILNFPHERKTRTKRGVVSFEVEWGVSNIVHIEYVDGQKEEVVSTAVTVTAATDEEHQ